MENKELKEKLNILKNRKNYEKKSLQEEMLNSKNKKL